MFSYEKLQDDTIESFTSSVPTARMRTGDFSELLSNGVQIFDPRTARLVNGVVVRDPFPGNIIPADRINPVARNVLGYFPAPNQAGRGGLLAEFLRRAALDVCATTSRWCASTTSGRSNQRTYGRFIRNFRREERYNFAGELNGVEITRGATDRFNFNYAVGHTAVLSPTTVLDLKGSWLRFNDDLFPLYTIDPASLGFSASTAGALRRLPAAAALQHRVGRRPPQRDASRRSAPSRAASTADARSRSTTSRFAPTLTKTAGAHTFKIGYDWRQLRQAETNLGWKAGAYAFDGTLHALDQRRREPVWPGHRRVHARDSPTNSISSKRAATTTRASTATARSCTTTGACPIASR